MNAIHADPLAVSPAPSRLMVDAPTRMLHALLAVSVLGAWASADWDSLQWLHVTLGYTVLLLWLTRVALGLVGPAQARFGLLLRRVTGAWAAFKSKPWSPSALHALALPASIALLLALMPIVPLLGLLQWLDLAGEWAEELHELSGNLMLLVSAGHVALVFASILLGKAASSPGVMWSGRIAGKGPDRVRANRSWAAGLLLALVLGFWGWQWMQAPLDRVPELFGLSAVSSADEHDDDD